MKKGAAMSHLKVTTIAAIAVGITVSACNRPEPAQESAGRDTAAVALSERNEDAAVLEKRVVDIELRWTEMDAKVKEQDRTPTAALRAEVKEDVANVRQAVANLKTTSPENWWDRHEEATERTADDIEADVLRFAKGKKPVAPAPKPEPVGTSAGFEERRNQFVARLRARIDALEESLTAVKVEGALQTELEDTRARIDKLQDDLDRLRNVSSDEWWSVSSKRVGEYIDRVERSIRRLDDDKVS
jgi:chromosome segregation ATPase